jgi:hypothetical protein
MYCTNNEVMLMMMDCSFTLIVGILILATMWLFCAYQICTKTNVSFLCINTINFKYLFKDPSYMVEEMFVIQQLGKHEFSPRHDLNVVHAYTCM